MADVIDQTLLVHVIIRQSMITLPANFIPVLTYNMIWFELFDILPHLFYVIYFYFPYVKCSGYGCEVVAIQETPPPPLQKKKK